MTEYQPGHLKHNAADNEVAIRTVFPEDDPKLSLMAWVVASPSNGVRHAPTAQVDEWADLYTPPAADG